MLLNQIITIKGYSNNSTLIAGAKLKSRDCQAGPTRTSIRDGIRGGVAYILGIYDIYPSVLIP